MSTNKQMDMSIIWAGYVSVDVQDRLVSSEGRFLTRAVQPGDTVFLQKDDETEHFAEVLQINTDDLLIFQALVGPPDPPPSGRTNLPNDGMIAERPASPPAEPVDIPPGEYIARIARYVTMPCPICRKADKVREIDHIHCNWCLNEMSLGGERVNCEACIAKMRARLVKERTISQEMTIFGGKRKIKLHALTVMEGDRAQQYQESFIIGNPGLSIGYVGEEVKKAQVAMMIDDDGHGQKPMDLVSAEPDKVLPDAELRVAVKFFKSLNMATYRGMISCATSLEALVKEACLYRIEDEPDDQELMMLADELVNSEELVHGTVPLFDGIEMLTFCVPTVEMVEEADNWAENFKQENASKMLEGRYGFIRDMSKLAAWFRRDSKTGFDETSVHGQRLAYIASLPTPYYYLYLSASRVFERRVSRANEVQVLGNS